MSENLRHHNMHRHHSSHKYHRGHHTPKFNISKIKIKRSINEHDAHVLSLIVLRDGRLASCSVDKTIKIHNLINNNCDLTLKGHTNNVTSIFELDNGDLISSSCDYTIKVWKIGQDEYECINTIDAHNDAVFKTIQISDNRIASCSADQTIKIWNRHPPHNLIATIQASNNWIRSLVELRNEKYLVAGGDGKSIQFINDKTYKKEKVLDNIYCCHCNSFLELENNKLAVGGENVITIVDLLTIQVEAKIVNNLLGFVCSIAELNEGDVICGGSNGIIMHFDSTLYTTYGITHELHDDIITSLTILNHGTLISCSSDKTIQIIEY